MIDAEAYARTRGATGATLETYSFQARPFYERLGYEVVGMLEGHPLGHVIAEGRSIATDYRNDIATVFQFGR